MTQDPTTTSAGRELRTHQTAVAQQHLRDLVRDPGRAEAMTFAVGDLTVDFSRARANVETLRLLGQLADELQLASSLEQMVSGAHLNATEDRAALHTALRLPVGAKLSVDGVDVAKEVAEVYQRCSALVEQVHSGEWLGGTGEQITDVVNIGIGGSDLGPRMVVAALRTSWVDALRVHFVSNVDPADLDATLSDLDPATTMFVVVSKTFTTVETLANATAARKWLVDALGEHAIARHLVAVTTNTAGAQQFGVRPEAIFGFWDWVGGRYSLSSPVGLAIEFAIGPTRMREFRGGMHTIDKSLSSDRLHDNPAVLLGLLDFWYTEYFDVTTKAVVPYSQDLALLPAHLQQLQMESNGKSVTADGRPVSWRTSPAVWGAPGTNGQHAFFQMLHQGTNLVPIDFIGVIQPAESSRADNRGDLLQASLVAQAAVLAIGQTADQLADEGVATELIPHKVMPGNRPSTVILLPDLTPSSVGQLIALYEHATVVAGLMWQINPFDQWGVELGKQMSTLLLPAFEGGQLPASVDPVSAATVGKLKPRN